MKMTIEAATKRLKVVFLHGYTQTDETLRQKTLAFKTTCAKYLDIKYVNSPHVLTKPPAFFDNVREGKLDVEIRRLEDASREAFVKNHGAKETYGNTWFFMNTYGEYSPQVRLAEIVGLEESFKVVFDACKEHNADGIMGFSLGALMTTLAVQRAMQDDSVGWKPRFAVLFSGPIHSNLMVKRMLDEGPKIDVPSLHLVSEEDQYVVPERSYALLKYFKEPELRFHSAGHTVPHTECKEVYQNFFTRFL
ncbi:ovarian cancer-associated gene 2 protein [Babesia caballi]|uniref:Ovarian cancer-associated gene 2 protein n=1 Tax=Babesia caballi TaxID=5871 RepID=A0AAV4M1P4_BABCB|nr:ovarian cancer-associated gene 2 protein [Babesia caballi]